MAEQQLVRTCKDVLAQSRWTAIFAVVEMLRGGGGLEVLHGQAVTQDILLQVGTGPKLLVTNIIINRNFLLKMMLTNFQRAPYGLQDCTTKEQNKASVLYIFRSDSRYECFIFSFINNAIVLLIWNSNSENKNIFSVRGI